MFSGWCRHGRAQAYRAAGAEIAVTWRALGAFLAGDILSIDAGLRTLN